jgi:hypothetical protein
MVDLVEEIEAWPTTKKTRFTAKASDDTEQKPEMIPTIAYECSMSSCYLNR